MDILEIVLLILSIFISVYYVLEKTIVKRKKLKGKKEIPGLPKTDQKLGNLGDLKAHGSLGQFLHYIHNKYGKVVSFYWMDTIVVSVCDHNYFKNVKHLFNRPNLIFSNFKPFIGEECIQFANGAEARDRRKCYDRSLTQEVIFKYIKKFAEVGEQEIKRISASPTMVVDSIQEMSLKMAMKTVCGSILSSERKEDSYFTKLFHIYNTVFNGYNDRIVENINYASKDNEEIEFQATQKQFYSLIDDIVTSRMKYLEEECGKDEDPILIDDIIHFHGDINIELIKKEVLVYMIAAFHTSGNLFAWCLYYLAKSPEYQERLFEEITNHNVTFSNSKQCFIDINNLPFLRACINESLRVSEVASFAARESNEDLAMGPHVIPANTPIILALGVSFYDPEVFKNPRLFDPTRFLDNTLPALSFVPFGFAGKRQCPGDRFSYLEVSIWLIEFVRQYQWRLQHPEEEVKKYYGLVTQMADPVALAFSAR